MQIDIKKYEVNKNFIRSSYDKLNGGELGYFVATTAVATSCPVIVVAYWVGEFSNWCPESIEIIERVTKFYKYTQILNKPEGSPV